VAAGTCLQERRKTHQAATTGAEEGARLALKAAEHSAKLKEEALKEQQELANQKKLTFQQKVRTCCTTLCTRLTASAIGKLSSASMLLAGFVAKWYLTACNGWQIMSACYMLIE